MSVDNTTQFRERGNEKYRTQDYEGACAEYTEGLLYDKDSIPLLVNRALAEIKLHKYINAIKDCTDALTLDRTNVKALVRRAMAWRGRSKPQLALDDLHNAAHQAPANVEIQKMLHAVEGEVKQQENEQEVLKELMNPDNLESLSFKTLINNLPNQKGKALKRSLWCISDSLQNVNYNSSYNPTPSANNTIGLYNSRNRILFRAVNGISILCNLLEASPFHILHTLNAACADPQCATILATSIRMGNLCAILRKPRWVYDADVIEQCAVLFETCCSKEGFRMQLTPATVNEIVASLVECALRNVPATAALLNNSSVTNLSVAAPFFAKYHTANTGTTSVSSSSSSSSPSSGTSGLGLGGRAGGSGSSSSSSSSPSTPSSGGSGGGSSTAYISTTSNPTGHGQPLNQIISHLSLPHLSVLIHEPLAPHIGAQPLHSPHAAAHSLSALIHLSLDTANGVPVMLGQHVMGLLAPLLLVHCEAIASLTAVLFSNLSHEAALRAEALGIAQVLLHMIPSALRRIPLNGVYSVNGGYGGSGGSGGSGTGSGSDSSSSLGDGAWNSNANTPRGDGMVSGGMMKKSASTASGAQALFNTVLARSKCPRGRLFSGGLTRLYTTQRAPTCWEDDVDGGEGRENWERGTALCHALTTLTNTALLAAALPRLYELNVVKFVIPCLSLAYPVAVVSHALALLARLAAYVPTAESLPLSIVPAVVYGLSLQHPARAHAAHIAALITRHVPKGAGGVVVLPQSSAAGGGGGGYHTGLRTDQAFRSLAKVVKDGKDDEAGNAAVALAECAKDREAAVLLRETGCLEALVGCMQTRTGHTQRNAAIALARASQDQQNLQRVRALHGIELMQMVKMESQ